MIILPKLSGLVGLIRDLARDADAAEAEALRTRTAKAKRDFVRAIFAWIEAVSFLMRQHALKETLKGPLTIEKLPFIAATAEHSYEVNEQGDVTTKPLRTKTSHNLLFSIRAFAETLGLPLAIDKGGRNWQDYAAALKIRDRITHPKNAEDIGISDAEVETVREAKGMVIAYLEVFLNPKLVEHIKVSAHKAKTEQIEIVLDLDAHQLKQFGIT